MSMVANNNQKIIHNVESGEIEILDLSNEEIILKEQEENIYLDWVKDFEKQKTEIVSNRQSLLDKLGITEEEAKLLLS